MILLGLARGAGGLVLLARGVAVDPDIRAPESGVSTIGAFLLLLGVTLVVVAVGILRRLRSFWLVGIVCTVLFVVDGAINGYVLYGRPGVAGTAANAIVAALILVTLLLGKGALRGAAPR